jgi:hypothetical protein
MRYIASRLWNWWSDQNWILTKGITAENSTQSPPTYYIKCQNYIVSIRCILDFHFLIWPLAHTYVQSLSSVEWHDSAVTGSTVTLASQFPNTNKKCLATFDTESFQTVTVNSKKLRVPSAIQTPWSVQKQVDKYTNRLSHCCSRKCDPTNLTCECLANMSGESDKLTGEWRCETKQVYLMQAHCIFCEIRPKPLHVILEIFRLQDTN